MKKLISLLFIIASSITTLQAQNWNEIIKLIASDAIAEHAFGYSVSISGDKAIVGAPIPFGDVMNNGSAYIFELVEDNWVETQKLTASDAIAGDLFGISVSISADKLIVGANNNDDSGANSGSAYVFELINGNWIEAQKLTASDADEGDRFGTSVSISGDKAIVGAFADDDNGSASGSAYIFNLINGSWTEEQKLIASDADAGDDFGFSVSISGDKAIVGAYSNADNGSRTGSAYIFKLTDGNWIEVQKLTASDAASGDEFGTSVSISGDKAIVGAWANSENGWESGAAYIFELSESSWIETQKLIASDGASGDLFGGSVSISGDKAIVGAFSSDNDIGSAYIFELQDGSWKETQKLTASDAAAEDEFGVSVCIMEDKAIVGAWGNADNGETSGSAYIFENANIGVGIPEINVASASHVTIYPNPTSGDVNLKQEGLKILSIRIYSMDGYLIYKQENLNRAMHAFNINKAADGIYVIEIETNSKKQHLKLIKQ